MKPDWMPWDMALCIVFIVIYAPFMFWVALNPNWP